MKDHRVLPLRIPVKITNPSLFYRDCETIELDVNLNPPEVNPTNGLPVGIDGLFLMSGSHVTVMDSVSSRIMDSQIVSSHHDWGKASMDLADKLLFQVDLAPGEARTFYILDASALAAVPPPIVKTFARYVPERHDDFAWERTALRTGCMARRWKRGRPSRSSAAVLMSGSSARAVSSSTRCMAPTIYYQHNGPSQDDYKVGKSRGCGGLGIWQDGKLYVSKNWRTYKIITTGPIRSEFELTYDAWDAGGRKISETKRISIDAGSNMSRVESTFSSDDKSPLADRRWFERTAGGKYFCGRMVRRKWIHGKTAPKKAWLCKIKRTAGMTYWQPQDFAKGVIGTAFILPGVEFFTNDFPDLAGQQNRRADEDHDRRPAGHPRFARHRAGGNRQAVCLLHRRGLERERRFSNCKIVERLCPPFRRAPRPAATSDDWKLELYCAGRHEIRPQTEQLDFRQNCQPGRALTFELTRKTSPNLQRASKKYVLQLRL